MKSGNRLRIGPPSRPSKRVGCAAIRDSFEVGESGGDFAVVGGDVHVLNPTRRGLHVQTAALRDLGGKLTVHPPRPRWMLQGLELA